MNEITTVLISGRKEGKTDKYWVGLLIRGEDKLFFPEKLGSLQEAQYVAVCISEFCKVKIDDGTDANRATPV